MINLQRLKYLKEHNPNDSLQFVAQYILGKIQRDMSEFSSYSNEEDWTELDQYLSSLDFNKRSKDYKLLKDMLMEVSDQESENPDDYNFEKALLKHLEPSRS